MSFWTDVRDFGKNVWSYTSPTNYMTTGLIESMSPKKSQGQDLLKEAQQKYIEGLQNQQKQIQKTYDEFSAKAPQLQEQAIGVAGDIQRGGANQAIKDINKSASSRGLLYSGLRQGAAAGAVTQSQQNIASQASDIAANIAQQKADLQNQATQAGLAVLGAQAGVNNQATNYALKAALTNRQQANQLLTGAGSAAGLGTGLLAGSSGSPAATKSSEFVGPGSWAPPAPTSNNVVGNQNQMALWSTGY